MPREAGEVKIQGCAIVRGMIMEQSPLAKGDWSGQGGREPCRRSYGMAYFVRIDRAEKAWRSWRSEVALVTDSLFAYRNFVLSSIIRIDLILGR